MVAVVVDIVAVGGFAVLLLLFEDDSKKDTNKVERYY